MLRSLLAGLAMSALTAALYALRSFLVPRQWGLGADAWDVLLLVGILLSAASFFAVFEAWRISRRLVDDAEARTPDCGAVLNRPRMSLDNPRHPSSLVFDRAYETGGARSCAARTAYAVFSPGERHVPAASARRRCGAQL
jgi:hypothetical protein